MHLAPSSGLGNPLPSTFKCTSTRDTERVSGSAPFSHRNSDAPILTPSVYVRLRFALRVYYRQPPMSFPYWSNCRSRNSFEASREWKWQLVQWLLPEPTSARSPVVLETLMVSRGDAWHLLRMNLWWIGPVDDNNYFFSFYSIATPCHSLD